MDDILTDKVEFCGLRANVRRDGQAQNGINVLLEGAPREHVAALVSAATKGAATLPESGDVYIELSLDARQRSELKRARAAQLSLSGLFVVVDVKLMPNGSVRTSGRLERLDAAEPASLLNGGRVIVVPQREQQQGEAAPAPRRTR